MTVYLSLEPVTNFSADELGGALFDLTHEPRTRKQLKVDFPSVTARYKTRDKAIAAVKKRQDDMYRNPFLQIVAIQLGESADTKRVQGVIALTPSPVPITTNSELIPGLNFAMWLSAYRTGELRNIAPLLIQPVFDIIMKTEYEPSTALWTVARPDHPISIKLLDQRWGRLQFTKVGPLESYKYLDGVRKKRRLYVSAPLQDLL